MNKEKLYYLSRVAFLSELTSQEINELAAEFQWQTYSEGSLIVGQGEKPSFLILICEGRVEVMSRKDSHLPPQTLGPNTVLGELSLVTGRPFPHSIRCIEKLRVLSISADDFARLLLLRPQIYRNIIGQLSESLEESNQLLSENKYKEVVRSAIKLTQYRDKFYGIWGSVRTTNEVERKLEVLKNHQGHLLILGERGTGRQMVAWHAHQRLFGEIAPFVVLDGRRFAQQWGESLLDIAAGGTLFIQEIDLIPPQIQLKLAESLQSQTQCFVIGSIQTQPRGTESKITNELQDCFIHQYSITPLRERKRDIPVLVQGILEKLAHKNSRKTPSLSPEATQLLLSHNYRQGNVTELIQVIERAFFLADKDVIGLDQIFFGPTSEKIGRTINLLQWPVFKRLLKEGDALRWLQGIAAIIFVFLILGLLFTPHLSPTLKALTLVWGLWWPGLALFSPFIGRLWCTFCPFATIMDLVQKRFNPRRSLPSFIIKYDYWIVSILFLFIFWLEVYTNMRFNAVYTGLLLITIQIAAILISILFPRHAWCRHFCPLGGFIGTASIGSILEVRSDATVCLNKCTTFDCYVGKNGVKGCPMSQHLPYLDNNLDCKLCFNCVKNCPHGSVQVNLRIPAREVWHLTRVNQGYTLFIGAMLGILFPLIYFEPLQKTWPSFEWHLWFTAFYVISALVGGALGWWIAKPFKTKAASTRIKFVFSFTPLVIAGHILYQVNFIPGIQDYALGAGYQGPAGFQSVFVPALWMTQGIVALIGFVLTSLTVMLVILKQNSKIQ